MVSGLIWFRWLSHIYLRLVVSLPCEGKSMAITWKPLACKSGATLYQHHAPCHAPWIRIIVILLVCAKPVIFDINGIDVVNIFVFIQDIYVKMKNQDYWIMVKKRHSISSSIGKNVVGKFHPQYRAAFQERLIRFAGETVQGWNR